MPGKPNCVRNASTSGVITPRFSATIGSSPERLLQRLEQRRARDPSPSGRSRAVVSPAGTSQ